MVTQIGPFKVSPSMRVIEEASFLLIVGCICGALHVFRLIVPGTLDYVAVDAFFPTLGMPSTCIQ